ncbi:MAG: hypothetical protein BMS9Abin04_199 [Planctomycetia bacterium]|nr:MAG: hypothetical protein BMS9Abin04_199 [Planctomycetia bacterium]
MADCVHLFSSALGWMAIVERHDRLCRLTFGHATAADTLLAVGAAATGGPQSDLVERLQAYADGAADPFQDVAVELAGWTRFGRDVLAQCRRIPWGTTITYGTLAARCGRPRAARAAGRVLAANPIPLIIPCHRVVAAGGSLGGYSALGGVAMKRRLLRLEMKK